MLVYLITNTTNGKRYVGQTVSALAERWRLHQKINSCPLLHNAINKYGADKFTVEPICEVPTIELMNEFEAEYIQRYCTLAPNGYNLTAGGSAPRHNDATRAKMSESAKNRKHRGGYPWSETAKARWRERLKGALNPRAKLSLEQVQELRSQYATGICTQAELAKQFGINQQQVSKAVRNITYRS